MESQIIQCRVCHNGIAKSAKVCPHCGAKNKKPFYTHWWIWVILGLFLLDYVYFYASKMNDTDPQSSSATTAAVTTAATTKATTKATESAIRETILYASDAVKITAKSLEHEAGYDAELFLLIENNTDKALTFQVRDVSVNGCMVDALFSSNVAAGKKVNDDITFVASDMKRYGIESIKKIEFYFHVFATSDWNDTFDTEIVRIVTNAENVEDFVFDKNGVLAYDANGIKIYAFEFKNNGSLGPELIVYIENNTKKDFTVQTRDFSVNGFMADVLFSSDVAAGKCMIDDITITKNSLEKNDIEAVKDIELYFHIFNSDDWQESFDSGKVALTVK